VEPFLGSGVVMFNISPKTALLGESNPHIINFYRGIQDGNITARIVKEYLTKEGERLLRHGGDHYYEVRDRFNSSYDPLDFLFLNRAGFNGLIRFNSKGGYNVPFCRKPHRFSKSYITKITNQVAWVESLLYENWAWKLLIADWRDLVRLAGRGDFLYLDPPYSGRHANYYDVWEYYDLRDLARFLANTECKFGLSLWYENRYRKNNDIDELFGEFTVKKHDHFYHVGPTEDLRNAVTEALITNV
jgi:DNA adenine methylase